MIKIRSLPIGLIVLLLCLTGCSQQFERITIYLENTADIEYKDAPVVIPRSVFEVSDTSLLPVIIDADGNYVPCQSDDTNGDGIWDELAFVHDFGRLDSFYLYIEWMRADQLPAFEKRTNIRFAKQLTPESPLKEYRMDFHTHDLSAVQGYNPYQLQGPAWENDKIGFRQSFDGKKRTSILGKRTSKMVMDSVGILPDGQVGDTYHVLAGWGMDLLDASQETGVGTISLQTSRKQIPLGVSDLFNVDNVDSCYYTLIAEGPIRSILRLDYKGWDTGHGKIDLTQYVTIWAGRHGYENTLVPSSLPDSALLTTGIPVGVHPEKHSRDSISERMGNLRIYHQGFVAMMTHILQEKSAGYYLGIALIIPTSNFGKDFYSGRSTYPQLKNQWRTTLIPTKKGKYHFYVYAGWELEDEGFRSADYFVRFIDNEVIRLNHPIRWRITGEDMTLPPIFSDEIKESV